MALRQCSKCDEMVDEAKAFCPGCGNALVEEEKPETSAFQELDHTVQFGHTMYNQMLEDMGLNISDTPTPNERRIEVIKPIETESKVPSVKARESALTKPTQKIRDEGKRYSNLLKYVLGGLAVIILLPIAVASAIIFFRYLIALIPVK
jgi:hypothetical protein